MFLIVLQLFGSEDQLEWIIFHDIIWTSKIYVRTVCPVSFTQQQSILFETKNLLQLSKPATYGACARITKPFVTKGSLSTLTSNNNNMKKSGFIQPTGKLGKLQIESAEIMKY